MYNQFKIINLKKINRMETILTIMVASATLFFAVLYIDDKIISRLPESSKIKAFWRKYLCVEDEDVS